MIFLKYILIILSLFFFSTCQDTDRIIRSRLDRYDREGGTVRTVGSQYVYGKYSRGDYEGPTCKDLDRDRDRDREEEDNKECQDQCNEMYGQEYNDCENVPAELVSQLYSLFERMRHFRQRDAELSRTMDDHTFGVMIDINESAGLELIKEWSSRESGEFLKWVAYSYSVARALLEHDEDHTILISAFRKLNSRYRLEFPVYTGTDLGTIFETFLFFANDWTQNQKNESAFIIFHGMLQEQCRDRNCKMQAYCLRKEYRTSSEMENRCPYKLEVYSRSSRHCYIYGTDVWNYWNQLNEDGTLRDGDFEPDFVFDQDECDDFCDDKNIDCERNVI